MTELNLIDYYLDTGRDADLNDWRFVFTEREQKEIKLAEVYARDFAHGTTGHNQLMIIAKLALMLDKLNAGLREAKK